MAKIKLNEPNKWVRFGPVIIFTRAFWLMCFISATLLYSEKSAIAAGAYGAPPLYPIAQMTVDDQNRSLVYPSSVDYDAVLDEIYLVNSGVGRIVVYGPDYFPRISIGEGRGLLAPTAVAVRENGDVYVTQARTRTNPNLGITILNGAFFVKKEIDLSQIPNADSFYPREIAIKSDGTIYLAGENTRGVMVIDEDGTFLRWVRPLDLILAQFMPQEDAPSPAEDQKPENGEDPLENNQVSSAGNEGTFDNIPEEFRPVKNSGEGMRRRGLEEVEGPVLINALTFDKNENLYLVSAEKGKIYVYGPDETFLFSFGKKGGSPGQLSQPKGVVVDDEWELIYVLDYMRHTLLMYNLEGEFLYEVGGRGVAPGWFNFPVGIKKTQNHQLIIVDLFNARVQVVELGYPEWQQKYGNQSEREIEQVEEQNDLKNDSAEERPSIPAVSLPEEQTDSQEPTTKVFEPNTQDSQNMPQQKEVSEETIMKQSSSGPVEDDTEKSAPSAARSERTKDPIEGNLIEGVFPGRSSDQSHNEALVEINSDSTGPERLENNPSEPGNAGTNAEPDELPPENIIEEVIIPEERIIPWPGYDSR